MTEKLATFFITTFAFLTKSVFGKYILVFIISCFPVLELKGGLLAASCLLNLPAIPSFLICLLGNMLPVPFILIFIMPLFQKLKKLKFMRKFVDYCEKKANKKKDKIEALKYYGLFVFVAIPLPTTGVWMGSLIAAMLEMDKKKSFIAIALGALVAGIIMFIISYGILGGVCS